MKKHPHLDAAIVAALLLAYVPDLAQSCVPDQHPIVLMLPEPASTNEDPAERL